MRVLDRLADTPAQVMTELGETLAQTPAARALFGDETRYEGFMRSVGYRWFVDPSARNVYPTEDHPMHSREFTADIRRVYAKYGARSRAGAIVDASGSCSGVGIAAQVGARRGARCVCAFWWGGGLRDVSVGRAAAGVMGPGERGA